MNAEQYSRPSIVLGTAGHIDHGKSTLVKALTGTDPDRLQEEKRRGITIELGFARLDLPNGTSIGVVDVPGHEKFVRQMIAGATGIDSALLVIAADDGIMPQTREHLAVLQLLGIPSCTVALTKIDLVDDEWVSFVRDETAALLASTPYAGSLIVPVSGRTGEGLDQLKAALQSTLSSAQRAHRAERARMPIDRVFTVKGAGTVVTGTLWSGSISLGSAVRLEPSGLESRVRAIQIHGADVERAGAGHRVALNLAGIDPEQAKPGDFIVEPDSLPASDRFDCTLSYLDPERSGKPLETGVRVRISHGTRETFGRMLLMDGKERLDPGETAWAQIRLEAPLAVERNDRFVMRSYSPVRVIGGGRVLEARPRRRSVLHKSDHAVLEALETGDDARALEQFVAEPNAFRSLSDIEQILGLTPDTAQELLADLQRHGKIVQIGTDRSAAYTSRASLQKAVATLERTLLTFHSEHPTEPGMQKAALRHAALPAMDAACFEGILAQAAHSGIAVVEGGVVSHAKAGAAAKRQAEQRADAALALLQDGGAMPPYADAIATALSCSKSDAYAALGALEARGDAVRIDRDLFYDSQAFSRMQEAVVAYLTEHGEASAAQLKDAMGTSRKYAIPVLEHFDATGVTARNGDVRTL